MKVEQISVFLENKAGRLAEVTRVLGEAGINIRALSLADTTDFGILRLIVDQYDRAREVLKAKGFTVGKTEVVAVEVPDRPGVAATTRTSARRLRASPRRLNSPLSRTRRNAFCKSRDISPISSMNRVPPSASSKRPVAPLVAPVKAPGTWPKSSL